MQTPYVDLGRQFRRLTEEQVRDPESFEFASEWGWSQNETWADIERRFRTVVLAEAGSGKTREMQERCEELKRANKIAFFLPLEVLESDDVLTYLDVGNQREGFQNWVKASLEPAWLFLDALDELKLRDGTLRRALPRLQEAVRGAEMRAHIVISCRPHDWYSLDETAFQSVFPPPDVAPARSDEQVGATEGNACQSPEERFLAPLRGKPGLRTGSQEFRSQTEVVSAPEKFEVYRLLPLREHQIEKFIRGSKVTAPEGLISEIHVTDAWDFARSPQDINELLDIWEERKSLGTRTQQHEAHIRMRLRDRSDRPAHERQLPEAQARLGVEKLALGLALSKKRTIRVIGESARASLEGSMDAAELLLDWKPSDLKMLLGLGIFNPPTCGRLGFHRRCVEEYLAALRLHRIAREGNASKGYLLQRLFATTATGEEVVIPSMRSIAIWIAQWNEDVRLKLIEIAPILLIADGDPESLPAEDRKRMVTAIVRRHGREKSSTSGITPANLRRFSSQELSATVRDEWQQAHGSNETIRFLISLVREGVLKDCTDLLNSVALAADQDHLVRILAVQALIACDAQAYVRAIAEQIVERPLSWPGKIIQRIATDLFPSYIDASQLAQIIKAVFEFGGTPNAHELEFRLLSIMANYDSASQTMIELRDNLATLILENKLPSAAHYSPSSQYSFLSASLVSICARQANEIEVSARPAFLRACFTANLFSKDNYGGGDTRVLHEALLSSNISREEIFLAELQFVSSEFAHSAQKGPIVSHASFIGALGTSDWEWLLRTAGNPDERQNIRLTAMLELVRLWRSQGSVPQQADELRSAANGDNEIENRLESWLNPKSHPEEEHWKKQGEERKKEEERRLEDWRGWRNELIRSPDASFCEPQIHQTRHNLLDWMMADSRSNASYQVWASGVGIEEAFGTDVKNYAWKAFSSYWREVNYEAPSRRAHDGSGTSYSWIYALNGVLAEADTAGWADKLTEEEVRKATLLSLVEINELPAFMTELANCHYQKVSATLGDELAAQLRMADKMQHIPLLQHLTHASKILQNAVAVPLLDFVSRWEDPPSDAEGKGAVFDNVSQVLRVLIDLKIDGINKLLKQACLANFEKAPGSPASVYWLRSLFSLDSDEACTVLERAITAIDGGESLRKLVVGWFGNLFGSFERVNLEFKDEQTRIAVLGRLCRLAYRYVVSSEDIQRESGMSYTPNSRDDAQSARAQLLNQLIDSPGAVASDAISKLATEPDFKEVREFLINRVRVRAVENTEPLPLGMTAVRSLEVAFECIPLDRDTMFTVVRNRIEDLQRDIAHHEFFPRQTIRSIDDEDEMQRMLALVLEAKSKNAYSVVREPETADGKKNDLRLRSNAHGVRAVIEVKLADKDWSVGDFVRALDAQLVGLYLRHEACRAGFLLLTYGGRRSYWLHPETEMRLAFPELIQLLSNKALEVERREQGAVKIAVIGLDLRDPPLPVAHR